MIQAQNRSQSPNLSLQRVINCKELKEKSSPKKELKENKSLKRKKRAAQRSEYLCRKPQIRTKAIFKMMMIRTSEEKSINLAVRKGNHLTMSQFK